MIKNLNGSHARIPLPPFESSHQLSTIIENPLDESSDTSDDSTITPNKPCGICSPPPLYTIRLKRNPKMTQFNLFSPSFSNLSF